MRVLLDTNAWLWMLNDDEQLGPHARAIILDDESDLILSAVCAWEISIKWSLGMLTLPTTPAELVDASVLEAGLQRLAIDFRHVTRVATLQPIHRDPFDRLLVAQAIEERLPILTSDPLVGRYGVATIDATA